MKKKKQKDNIIIPRKAFIGIVPMFPIVGILLSKGDIGPLLLFIMGISLGVLTGKGFFEK